MLFIYLFNQINTIEVSNLTELGAKMAALCNYTIRTRKKIHTSYNVMDNQ